MDLLNPYDPVCQDYKTLLDFVCFYSTWGGRYVYTLICTPRSSFQLTVLFDWKAIILQANVTYSTAIISGRHSLPSGFSALCANNAEWGFMGSDTHHKTKHNTSVSISHVMDDMFTGQILGLRPANERRRYKVTPSPIDWAQTWNQPCVYLPQHVILCFG